MTGGQAVQMVRAGPHAIYLSGWQVAADANLVGRHLSRPEPVPGELRPGARAAHLERAPAGGPDRARGGRRLTYWLAPIVADAEAGFGGPLNAFEIMKAFIEAGAAAVHFEDQLSSEKKCGHLGGKVLVPTCQFVRTLVAARLAADVLDVPTLIVARTDALSATLLTSDIDEADRELCTGERTPEGFFRVRDGIDAAIARGLRMRRTPTSSGARRRRPTSTRPRSSPRRSTSAHPGKLLAYNCSPSFNWRRTCPTREIASFQRDLAALGYRFQFITLAGFHSLNLWMFELARGYRDEAMTAYVGLQEREFELEADGYTATRHQREVGAGYFDQVLQAISGGESSTLALTRLDRGAAVRRGKERGMTASTFPRSGNPRKQPPKPRAAQSSVGSRRDATRPRPPIVTRAETAPCTCPEHCERDHEND